jgi:ABC-2 type transport system permease protein
MKIADRKCAEKDAKLMRGIAPTTHFVSASQAILYRGGGLEAVWPQFLALLAIGTVFFSIALTRLRKTIGQMA